jgi:osmotically-inducible protein OsmY
MADKNLNQENLSRQSNKDWEENRANQQDWAQDRGGKESYRNSGYEADQNNNRGQRYRDVRYSGDSAHGTSDENRGYEGGNMQHGQFGSSGFGGNRNSGQNYNQENNRQNQYGNMGNNGGSGWNQRQDSSASFNNRQEDRWNNGQSQQYGHGGWGQGQGRQDWGRGNVDAGNEYNDRNDNHGNRNYGNQDDSRYRNSGHGYNQDRNQNMYGGDTRNYGNANQGGFDRNWWDKTKSKVSSWFDSDDDNNNDRNRGNTASHRGKGPSDYRRSQDRIREDICDRLTDDDHVDASRVRVSIENDVVILSGTVNSREEKRRAEDLVESISGVRDVENRLRVGSYDTASRHEYTGTTTNVGGIGDESGTTNEIIRNVENDQKTDSGKDRNKI